MKRLKLLLITLSVATASMACSSVSVIAHPSRGFYGHGPGRFKAALAGHGQWLPSSAHGRVWRPWHMGSQWRPYTEGRWAWQNDAWTWHSDYSWGQSTFHYGRWLDDARHGWVWIPGDTWGPGWVQWRSDTDHVGWAAMGPRGLEVATRTSSDWCFMERRHLGRRHVRGRLVRPTRRDHLLRITRARPAGPRRQASRGAVSPPHRSRPSRARAVAHVTHAAKPARKRARGVHAKPAKAAKIAKKARKKKKHRARVASGRGRRFD